MRLRTLFTTAALLATSAHAQMAVVDLKALIEARKQVDSWNQQLSGMRSQLAAMTGSRNMGSLLHNPTLYNYLPPDAAAALRANAGGLGSARALEADQRLFGIDKTSLDPQSATATSFTARQAANANAQLINDQAYQASAERIRQLDALTNSIDAATDPMAINALAVRVQAEQGRIANEQARLNLLANMAANAERVREQQSREIVMQATRGPIPAGW